MRTTISPFRRILAMVVFPNRQPTLDFGGGNRSLCPTPAVRDTRRDRLLGGLPTFAGATVNGEVA